MCHSRLLSWPNALWANVGTMGTQTTSLRWSHPLHHLPDPGRLGPERRNDHAVPLPRRCHRRRTVSHHLRMVRRFFRTRTAGFGIVCLEWYHSHWSHTWSHHWGFHDAKVSVKPWQEDKFDSHFDGMNIATLVGAGPRG